MNKGALCGWHLDDITVAASVRAPATPQSRSNTNERIDHYLQP